MVRLNAGVGGDCGSVGTNPFLTTIRVDGEMTGKGSPEKKNRTERTCLSCAVRDGMSGRGIRAAEFFCGNAGRSGRLSAFRRRPLPDPVEKPVEKLARGCVSHRLRIPDGGVMNDVHEGQPDQAVVGVPVRTLDVAVVNDGVHALRRASRFRNLPEFVAAPRNRGEETGIVVRFYINEGSHGAVRCAVLFLRAFTDRGAPESPHV